MDKIILYIIGAIVVAGAGFWLWQGGLFAGQSIQPAQLPNGIVLFFAEDCPHCKIVEDFLKQNKIDEKLQFSRIEVPFAGKNSPELQANALAALQKAENCKIDTKNGMSIPFLWDGDVQKCYIGQNEVIDFFKEKSGIK